MELASRLDRGRNGGGWGGGGVKGTRRERMVGGREGKQWRSGMQMD